MNMPFSQYQLAHVRKAAFAGIAAAGTAVTTALLNGMPLTTLETWPALAGVLGAFVVGFGGTFQIPNKDFSLVEKVIEDINPVLGNKVAVLLDPAIMAHQPSDQPVAEQVTPAPLVPPPGTTLNVNAAAATTQTDAPVPAPVAPQVIAPSTPVDPVAPQPVDPAGPTD